MGSTQRLKDLHKQVLIAQILSLPGALMIGLGLYGFFVGAGGNAFHPLLNDQRAVYGLLIIGAAIEALGMARLIALIKRRVKLSKQALAYTTPGR